MVKYVRQTRMKRYGHVFLLSIILCPLAFADLTFERPATIPAGNALFEMGYLDVTLYGADPGGTSNSTSALKKAINDARTYQLVVYFPTGTYLVNDSLGIWVKGMVICDDVKSSIVLVGSKKGARPVIKLMNNVPKFSDPSNPLPLIWFWALPEAYVIRGLITADDPNYYNPLYQEADINFDQMIIGIDIDLNGNPGAIGVRHAGAQGAGLEDMTINATGAFAGLGNLGGLGSGIFNIKVIGGKYGAYINSADHGLGLWPVGHISMVGCTFIDQEDAAIHIYRYATPMLLTGCYVKGSKGPVHTGYSDGARGGLNFIDCIIELESGPVAANDDRDIYFRNCYVKGAESVADGWTVDNRSSWTWVKEFADGYAGHGNLIDGVANGSLPRVKEENKNVELDDLLVSLRDIHIWNEAAFPFFEDDGVVNVKDAAAMNGDPAKGDYNNDDTRALQYAIDNYDKVFMPKGNYKITGTLTLKANTRLFGISKTHSIISPHDSWNPGSEEIMVRTVDDKDAVTVLAFTNVAAHMYDNPHFTHIEWRAGKNSMMRDAMAGITGAWTSDKVTYHNRYRVTGSGGGRIWAACARQRGTGDNGCRSMLVTGTSEPLRLYPFNGAEDPSNINLEIVNSSDIRVYFPSGEGGNTNTRIDNSENVSVFGMYKNNACNTGGRGAVEVMNSTDVLVSQAVTRLDGNGKKFLETYGGQTQTLDDNCTLFKRGEPGFTPIVQSSSVLPRHETVPSSDIVHPTGTGVYSLEGARLPANGGMPTGIYIMRVVEQGKTTYKKIWVK